MLKKNSSSVTQTASGKEIYQQLPTNIEEVYLEKFIAEYCDRTKTSKQLAQAFRPTLADPRVAAGFSLPLKEMCYPIVAKKSFGSKIWDVDGNEYIDLIMGFGINLLGHNPSFIKQALIEQLDRGIEIGVQTQLAGEVAQLISELTGMERVTFSNTGTEAVMTAIRIARAATKRNKIAIFSGSYHGHSDATLVDIKQINGNLQTVAKADGIPDGVVGDTLVLDYGNYDSLEIIKNHHPELAAILVEPVQSCRPDLQPREFLQQLRKLTAELGIVLIFDEMVTGFRVHQGGAQAWFDVQADIATYGKIVGGGLPIGVIAGKAAYMDKIDGGMWHYGDDSSPRVQTTFFAGTYCKHPLSLAAAKAILEYLKAQGNTLQIQLGDRTTQFARELNNCFASFQLPIKIANFGSCFDAVLDTNSAPSSSSDSVSRGIDLLSYHLLYKGVLIRAGSGCLSTAHTDVELNYVIESIEDSLKQLRQANLL
ncbi:MAG TPA: aspartate aminotransferase family protein [Coleofasciculaceae cyanobacterium]|jgi:glutamate-1-semialdehyde aminotransferase